MDTNMHIALFIVILPEDTNKDISELITNTCDIIETVVISSNHNRDYQDIVFKCQMHGLYLHITQYKSDDACDIANHGLSYVDRIPDITHLLLLSSKERCVHVDRMLASIKRQSVYSDAIRISICIHPETWFYRTCLIRIHKRWRYKGAVYPRIVQTTSCVVSVLSDKYAYILSHEETMNDIVKNICIARLNTIPNCLITMYTLAKAYDAIGDLENALVCYRMRVKAKARSYELDWDGIRHETFQSCMNIAKLYEFCEQDWGNSLEWYMEAYEHEQRAEPLIEVAEHYIKEGDYGLAYLHSKLACRIKYPRGTHVCVNKYVYTYMRWYTHAIVSYNAGKYIEGVYACKEGIRLTKEKEYLDALYRIHKMCSKKVSMFRRIQAWIQKRNIE